MDLDFPEMGNPAMPEDQQADVSETDSGTQTETTVIEQTTTSAEKDWEAEAKKWQAMSRETEKRARAGAEAQKRLAALEESQKTEAQKIADRAAEAESRAAKAEQELARFRVANAKKVPPEWVDRLRGDTEEELAADADKILAAIKAMQPTGPKPDQSQGARATGAANADMNTLLRAAAGRG